MNIIFKKIKLNNFLSFGESEVDLDNQGYVLVNGINNSIDDNAKSNGAGKSTLFEAIVWCITGTTIRGNKNVTNIYGDDGAYVEVNFEIDGNDYKLIRTKDHSKYKSNLKLFINGEDKSGKGLRDTEQYLKSYLPDLSATLIGSVIILGQGLPQRFTNNTPAGRKEILEQLSNSDFMIYDIKDRIAKRKMIVTSELTEKEKYVQKLMTEKSIYNDQISKSTETLNHLLSLNSLSQDTLSSLYNDYLLQVEYENNQSKLCADYNDKLGSVSDKLKTIIDTKTTEINDVKYNEKTTTVKLTAEKEILNNNYRTLQQEIIRLDAVTDICPTCGQHISGVVKIDTTDKKIELNEMLNRLNEFDSKFADCREITINEIKLIESKYAVEIEKCRTEIATLTELRNTAENNSRNKSTKMYQEYMEYKYTFDNYKNNVDNLNTQIAENTMKINNCNNQIEDITADITEINKHLDVLGKFDSATKKEFRGYLLSNVIDYINVRAKEYCKDLFNTDKINFMLDGNAIEISYNQKEYECLSGGEKQKIDLIIQFAIRDMLCQYLNFSSNILVLDEVIDFLDTDGASQVINLIIKKLNNISSVYFITHHNDLDFPCDNELIVIKSNNISRVK